MFLNNVLLRTSWSRSTRQHSADWNQIWSTGLPLAIGMWWRGLPFLRCVCFAFLLWLFIRVNFHVVGTKTLQCLLFYLRQKTGSNSNLDILFKKNCTKYLVLRICGAGIINIPENGVVCSVLFRVLQVVSNNFFRWIITQERYKKENNYIVSIIYQLKLL